MSIMSLMSLFEKDYLVVPPCLFFGGRGGGCVVMMGEERLWKDTLPPSQEIAISR